jgi:chromosomal replication initiation ATPase DnaA
MYVIRQDSGMSYKRIGYRFGRGHTATYHGVQLIEQRIAASPPFAALVERLKTPAPAASSNGNGKHDANVA